MSRVSDAFDVDFHRMLGDGVLYRDLMELRAAVTEPVQWCDGWAGLASAHEKVARDALAQGFAVTAAEAFWRASLYLHFAANHFTNDRPEKRAAAERRKVDLFSKAASLLRPKLQRVEIPFAGKTMPAYLRLPEGVARPPCVILFGGLGSTKEDSLSLSDLLIERGLATLAFDGPGQGEMHAAMKLIPDFERCAEAAVDFLTALPSVDGGRIGIVGRSTGGHWAAKAAARDKRIKAAVSWGLLYHLRDFDAAPQGLVDLFVHAAGLKARDEARDFLRAFDLAGVAAHITCPFLIVQGGQDKVFTVAGARQFIEEMNRPAELLTFPDSGHCCHSRSYIVKPAIADFFAKHLGAKQP